MPTEPYAPIPTDERPAPLLTDAVARFLAHRRNAGLSASTLALYTRQLAAWQAWRAAHSYGQALAAIVLDELRAYLTYLQTEHLAYQDNPGRPAAPAPLAPATVDSIRRTIRTAWNFWIDEDLLSNEQATFFQRKRIPAPKVPQKIRKTYPFDVFAALLAAAEQGRSRVEALRNRAMLLMLYDTGMRVSELCDLSDEDMNDSERQCIVTGKGTKQRYCFWTERTSAALHAYRAVRPGEMGGPLFRGYGSKNSGNRLRADGVRSVIKALAKKAHIEPIPGAPVHALRHTMAHRFLDNGGDGLHLQQLLGHESMETTQRYTKENPTGLRRAYRKAMEE